MSKDIDVEGAELMKSWLETAVSYIVETRRRMNRPPYMATTSNIKNVLSKSLANALEQAVKEGWLTERRTLNESAYEFTNDKIRS